MSGFFDRHTPFLVQDIWGDFAHFHTRRCQEYGTNIVGGIAPRARRAHFCGIPLFSSVKEARSEVKCAATMIFTPPRQAKQALLDAIAAQIPLIVCCTEGIARRDMLFVKEALKKSASCLIGPSASGLISPGEALAGLLPIDLYKAGSLGVISSSSSLACELLVQLQERQIGVSTHISFGSDELLGSSFADLAPKFEEDSATQAIFFLAEEVDAMDVMWERYLAMRRSKPLGVYIAKKDFVSYAQFSKGDRFCSRSRVDSLLEKSGIAKIESLSCLGDLAAQLLKENTC
ncbi:MAG: hypothetical protein AAGF04_04600 [Chlamydiota bacterium]